MHICSLCYNNGLIWSSWNSIVLMNIVAESLIDDRKQGQYCHFDILSMLNYAQHTPLQSTSRFEEQIFIWIYPTIQMRWQRIILKLVDLGGGGGIALFILHTNVRWRITLGLDHNKEIFRKLRITSFRKKITRKLYLIIVLKHYLLGKSRH